VGEGGGPSHAGPVLRRALGRALGRLLSWALWPLVLVLSRLTRTRFAQRHWAPHLARLQMSLYRRTGGRLQLSAVLVPTLVLVTRGARTGQRHETPLMCSPADDGTFLVAGSNWGRANHPAWSANLIADPHAEVIYRRRRYAVRAQLLSEVERGAAWPLLEARWPHYRDYERVAGRAIRVFRLLPQ
jgi:deazaflavin-dependent oxidoreductase (nitroreductase family)